MRGDLAMQARLALRPRGLVGVATAAVGLIGVAAVYLPWYELRREVTMLGGRMSGEVGALAGWEAQPWIWLGAAASLAVAGLGLLVAIDRPPRDARGLLIAASLVLAAVAGSSGLAMPPVERFVSAEQLQQLRAAAEVVPDDVGVSFSVVPAVGVWVALVAAVLLLGAAFVATRAR